MTPLPPKSRDLPAYRTHRMRRTEPLRALIRESRLAADQLILPVFARPGVRIRAPIPSLPGHFQLSVDQLVKEAQAAQADGVRAILLFGMPRRKDERAREAHAADGVIQQAVRALKAQAPDLLIVTDVCLCAYTTHGHCALLASPQDRGHGARGGGRGTGSRRPPTSPSGQSAADPVPSIDLEATLAALGRIAVSHAQAGADLVAPSDMMDGNVGAVRRALDEAGFDHLPIMAYSAKFASALYAPFREAVNSAPRFGDRRSYQMDAANADEALREARLDIEAGADIIMVKPALAYLDIILRIKQELRYPVAAFSVSGEYAMVKAAAARGWLPERPTSLELLLALKRAGADIIITYWAREAARLLHG